MHMNAFRLDQVTYGDHTKTRHAKTEVAQELVIRLSDFKLKSNSGRNDICSMYVRIDVMVERIFWPAPFWGVEKSTGSDERPSRDGVSLAGFPYASGNDMAAGRCEHKCRNGNICIMYVSRCYVGYSRFSWPSQTCRNSSAILSSWQQNQKWRKKSRERGGRWTSGQNGGQAHLNKLLHDKTREFGTLYLTEFDQRGNNFDYRSYTDVSGHFERWNAKRTILLREWTSVVDVNVSGSIFYKSQNFVKNFDGIA